MKHSASPYTRLLLVQKLYTEGADECQVLQHIIYLE